MMCIARTNIFLLNCTHAHPKPMGMGVDGRGVGVGAQCWNLVYWHHWVMSCVEGLRLIYEA